MAQWFGLAVAAAAACMVVRAQQPQLASLCAVAAGAMLLLAAMDELQTAQSAFARLAAVGGLPDSYLSALVKVLGVSFLSELAAQTREDMGENGLALKAALAGRLCVFTLTAPLILRLLEMILELVP